MTKRILAVLFAVVLIFSAALIPASAAAEYGSGLDDDASLLNPGEQAQLTQTISDLSSRLKCNIGFLTVNDLSGADFSFDGTTADYADRYYEKNFGMNTDGVLVMLVLSDEYGRRTVYFSTSGKCISRLSDDEREAILDDMIDNHNPDTYGYYDFLNAAAVDLGEAIPPHLKWYMLPLALIIGFVISMIIMSILKKQLKSVELQRSASNYVRPGSMSVTASRDTYLYSTTSRTAKPKNSGSSSHTSSGGGTHGGGGRSF